MTKQGPIEAAKAQPDNLRIWNTLAKTDPAHTKGFKRAGGFSGTAIKPIWVERMLTEMFGPCGIGWGTEEPDFRLVSAGEEVLVFCTVTGWYVENGHRATVHGVGGDKVLAKNKFGLSSDDEAFKKAATDAIGNAFKHIGVAADIHMGQFDDNKYVQAVAKEFADAGIPATVEKVETPKKVFTGPHKSKTALWAAVRAFTHTANGIGDLAEFLAWLETEEVKELIAQCKVDAPGLWSDGLPDLPEYVPLEILIDQRKRDLEQIDELANASGANLLRAG